MTTTTASWLSWLSWRQLLVLAAGCLQGTVAQTVQRLERRLVCRTLSDEEAAAAPAALCKLRALHSPLGASPPQAFIALIVLVAFSRGSHVGPPLVQFKLHVLLIVCCFKSVRPPLGVFHVNFAHSTLAHFPGCVCCRFLRCSVTCKWQLVLTGLLELVCNFLGVGLQPLDLQLRFVISLSTLHSLA